MFVWQEGTYPSVMVRLRAVPAVVLICGNDLHFWRFGGIVADGIGRVVMDELARHEFLVDGIVDCLLLRRREGAPEVFTFRLIEMCHSTVCSYQRPKILEIHNLSSSSSSSGV